MKIVVAAGTGFIGKPLVERLLKESHSVVVLTRDPRRMSTLGPRLTVDRWDGETVGPWSAHLESADAVINLAGELIAAKRWTSKQKEIILRSRLASSNALVSAVERSSKKPSVFISMSAVGYYGDVPAGDVTESSPMGSDFLSNVCHSWEEASLGALRFGVRTVVLRLGVVLAGDGGALKRIVAPFRFYTGGYLGSGKQWFPWVHRDDVLNVILFALKNSLLAGPVNVTAPDAATMKNFCATLGKVLRSPSWTFVPGFALHLAFGEMAQMLLTGQKAVPQKLTEAGFNFEYPSLEGALRKIFPR